MTIRSITMKAFFFSLTAILFFIIVSHNCNAQIFLTSTGCVNYEGGPTGRCNCKVMVPFEDENHDGIMQDHEPRGPVVSGSGVCFQDEGGIDLYSCANNSHCPWSKINIAEDPNDPPILVSAPPVTYSW